MLPLPIPLVPIPSILAGQQVYSGNKSTCRTVFILYSRFPLCIEGAHFSPTPVSCMAQLTRDRYRAGRCISWQRAARRLHVCLRHALTYLQLLGGLRRESRAVQPLGRAASRAAPLPLGNVRTLVRTPLVRNSRNTNGRICVWRMLKPSHKHVHLYVPPMC